MSIDDRPRPKVKDLGDAIEKLTELTGKIDKKALAASVGLMCMSWAALPIIYYLIVHKNRNAKESKSREMEKMRDKSKETETSENG